MTSFHFRITPTTVAVNRTAVSLALEQRAKDLAESIAPPVTPVPAEDSPETLPPGGGDGFAFLFRSLPSPSPVGIPRTALGRGASGLGFAGLEGMGIAVEFDTKMDLSERDPNGNHVSVHILRPQDAGFSSYDHDHSSLETDTMAIAGGVFWSPVSQLKMGVLASLVDIDNSAAVAGYKDEEQFNAAFVTWWNF